MTAWTCVGTRLRCHGDERLETAPVTHRTRGLARGVRATAGTGMVFAMAGAAAWLSLSVIAAPADAAWQAAPVSSGVPDGDAGIRVAGDMTAACTNCAAGSVPVTAHPPTPEPLHLAAAHGFDPEVVWQLEAGNRYWARGEREEIALHRAAARNPDPSGVTELLKAGADLEARDEEGRTALHWAAASNASPAVVAALLDAGAELEARDKTGRTPLHWAAKSNHAEAVVAALVDAGADLEARDLWGNTPLYQAVGSYVYPAAPAVFAALLKAGSEVEAADDRGC